MNMTKKLLLGAVTSAFVLGSSAAMATDAPRAPSRTPVWACDITGFWELPGTDICFKVGGFARADFMYSSSNNASDTFDTWNIAFNGNSNERVRFHANVSRVNFDARSNTEFGTVRAFIEMDFQGGGGNQVLTNSSNPRLRHAFVQFGNMLAGQTWSNAMILAALPDAIDQGGMSDFTLLRQGQLRWTQPVGNGVTIAIALENPENMDRGRAGHAARDMAPDLTANIAVSQSWGTVQLSGVLRQMEKSHAADTGTVGWMVNIGGSFNIPIANGNDNFKWFAAYSDGGTRYLVHSQFLGRITNVGLTGHAERNLAGDLLKSWAINGAFQHFWSNNLRSSLIAGHTRMTNINATPTATDRVTTVAGNLIWSPVPRVDMGVEVTWGERELVNGANTSATKVAFMVRRSF